MKLVGSGTKTPTFVTSHLKGRTLDLLHATLEECLRKLDARGGELTALPRDLPSANRPASENPMGLTLDQLARRLRYAECGGPLLSVKPRQTCDRQAGGRFLTG